MLKADQLTEYQSYRAPNGAGISLRYINEGMLNLSRQYQIPLAVTYEQIKYGGVFSSQTEECLLFYHPSHTNDYLGFCVTLRKQGTMAFITLSTYGVSKQLKISGLKERGIQQRKGQSLSYKIGNKLAEKIQTRGAKSLALGEENEYYNAVFSIFEELLNT